jgi:hypothetical protein
MHGGAKTGDDVAKQEPVQQQWLKRNTHSGNKNSNLKPLKRFDVEKE